MTTNEFRLAIIMAVLNLIQVLVLETIRQRATRRYWKGDNDGDHKSD